MNIASTKFFNKLRLNDFIISRGKFIWYNLYSNLTINHFYH